VGKYVYKIYLCACPTELPHCKEITMSFKQMPVTVAVIWKEIYFSSSYYGVSKKTVVLAL
jgi:hypothetical protein